jgi:hypothetical protein
MLQCLQLGGGDASNFFLSFFYYKFLLGYICYTDELLAFLNASLHLFFFFFFFSTGV